MSPMWIVLSVLVTLGGAERFACKGRILGAYYADAKSGCKAFHVCVRVAGGGIRDFRFFCPPGTLFHQEAQTCTDWGDDDPLACPADLYDGSFDLYKIGSGYDTKKLSSSATRDDEAEFGLQRAETGDRRLQNQNNGASDLRAAHSSDFFSGQRDRGRDDTPAPAQSSPASSSRQSFRRPTTSRTPPSPTTQYTATAPPPTPKQYTPQQYTPKQYTPQQYTPQQNTPQQYTPQQYETSSKRKLLRKRPVHVPSPTTYAPPPAPTNLPPNTPPPQQKQAFPAAPQQTFRVTIPPAAPQQQYRATAPPAALANLPPQYKDEYVEVPRVTPKPLKLQNTGSPAPFSLSTTAAPFTKKEGLVELFNYDSQSTPALNIPNRQTYKVRNNFNVSPDLPREQDFVRTKSLNSNSNGRNTPSTVDYNATPRLPTTNVPYKNFNSVSYEPEKNNYISLSGAKQNYNYFNNPSTTPSTTTYYTTTRAEAPANLNTVAYNTNNGINSGVGNFINSDEDDGQYRLPHGEDDGQYRPELYEREREDRSELLSGAHSLNIAASGNRLPEDQKQFGKGSQNFKPAQTAAPRPFRPAPTPTSTATAPEPTTTFRPQTISTQRTFDLYQTYTTTSAPVSQYVPSGRPQTTQAVAKSPEAVSLRERPQTRPPAPPTAAATKATKAPVKPTTRAPNFSHPANNKEDNSYDYAYYDSDPGFSEYDPIEEFGKTKSKA